VNTPTAPVLAHFPPTADVEIPRVHPGAYWQPTKGNLAFPGSVGRIFAGWPARRIGGILLGLALTSAAHAQSNEHLDLGTLPTGATGTYDNNSELTSATLAGTTTNYAYNADGQRLTSKQGSTTITSGTWNGAGQLTAYTSPAASMTAATYDGTGLRASATTGSGSQAFTWNTTGQIPELLMDSANAYIYGTGLAPAEQVNLSTGTITYPVTDSLGSVRGAVNSAGTLTGTTAYDAWGNPQTTAGLTSTTPFGYAGGYTDPTGLIYLINRYYDPQTGQFTSVDPAVAQTSEPYAYAAGNPVSNTDPLGNWCWTWSCTWRNIVHGLVVAGSIVLGLAAVSLCTQWFPWCIAWTRTILSAIMGGGLGVFSCWVNHWCHNFEDYFNAFAGGFVGGLLGSWLGDTGAGVSRIDRLVYRIWGWLVNAAHVLVRKL